MDLGQLFYDCTMDGKLTGAERETLLAVYEPEMIEDCANVRVTEDEMQAVLERYFGVDLADCDLGTMNQWQHCAETGAWVSLTATPNAFDPEFEGGEVLENGDTALYYRRSRRGDLRAVVLRNVDGVWQVQSNRIVEE